MVRDDLAPAEHMDDREDPGADQKLRIVLDGISNQSLVSTLCERNQISESEFYEWRDTSLAGATQALVNDESSR